MANPCPNDNTNLNNAESNFKLKAAKRLKRRFDKCLHKYQLTARLDDDVIIDLYIDKAEDEQTALAKMENKDVCRVTLDTVHSATKKQVTVMQKGHNVGQALSTAVRRFVCSFKCNNQQVGFSRKTAVATFNNDDDATMVTYNSGVD